jgi:hypothetical protein
MMMGMFQSKSVHLSKIAVKIPGKAKTLSIDRRLRRFVNNEAVDAPAWYQPIAQTWLIWQAESTGQIRLIVDGTKIGFGYQLLIVALAFRRLVLGEEEEKQRTECDGGSSGATAIGLSADPQPLERAVGR